MFHSLFIYSSTDGHPGCPHTWAIVYKAAVCTCVGVYNVNTFFPFVGKYQGAGWLSKSVCSFARNCQTVSLSNLTILRSHQLQVCIPLLSIWCLLVF